MVMAGKRSPLPVPEELEEEVLVRLPVKSIIRFESVCKAWHSKINSTLFKETYEQQRNSKSEKTVVVHTMKLKDLFKMAPSLTHEISESAGLTMWNKIYSMGPLSNGIYCLASIPTTPPPEHRVNPLGCRIALCNPATHDFKFLPPFPSRFRSKLATIVSSDNSNIVCGFTRLPGCLGYKVVVIVNYSWPSWAPERFLADIERFLVFVYSSSSGEWEVLDPSDELRGTYWIESPTEVCSQRLLNGAWHWLASTTSEHKFVVLSFNFAHHSFDLINAPPSNDDILQINSLMAGVVVLHDHLVVIYTRGYYTRQYIVPDSFEFSVWMMMEYGVEESWTRIFNVHSWYQGHISLLYGIDYSVAQATEEGESDGIVIERLIFTNDFSHDKNVISFDQFGGHQVSALCYNPTKDISFNTCGISSYKETLERLIL